MAEWVYGRNAVYETLRAQRRRAHMLLVAENAEKSSRLQDILSACQQQGLPISYVPRHRLDAINHGHQGVALQVDAYPYVAAGDILDIVRGGGQAAFILLLDALQDPQNFGALLRTAEAVGVQGIVLPYRRAAHVTPAVVKASSGASEYLRIARANLHQTIIQLKEAGVWIVGLEHSPRAKEMTLVDLQHPIALVVGSEGSGLRPLIREACDHLWKLPMKGQINSYNAAVAGSIALFLTMKAREEMRKTIDD